MARGDVRLPGGARSRELHGTHGAGGAGASALRRRPPAHALGAPGSRLSSSSRICTGSTARARHSSRTWSRPLRTDNVLTEQRSPFTARPRKNHAMIGPTLASWFALLSRVCFNDHVPSFVLGDSGSTGRPG